MVFWLVIVLLISLLWQVIKRGQNEPTIPEISYSEFLSQVESGNVSRVTIASSRSYHPTGCPNIRQSSMQRIP